MSDKEIWKPCPFCGGLPYVSKGETGNGDDWYYIECIDCEAMAPLNIWNKRDNGTALNVKGKLNERNSDREK